MYAFHSIQNHYMKKTHQRDEKRRKKKIECISLGGSFTNSFSICEQANQV
jgi:hypothetical protein